MGVSFFEGSCKKNCRNVGVHKGSCFGKYPDDGDDDDDDGGGGGGDDSPS